jgi:serine/threonine protein kinase
MESRPPKKSDAHTTEPLEDSFELRPEAEVGRFVIERKIKEGGWGYVYAAHSKEDGTPAVVKTIKPDRARWPNYRRRFELEQEALEDLGMRPNLSPPLEWGRSEQGLLWLAMRWIDGRDLYQVLFEEGPLDRDPTRAARLIAQAADGLDEVHGKKGIVHRDVHPGNLMVEYNDHLLVIDFGLAKRFNHPSGSPAEPLESAWTAPEGRRGEEMTPQSDVYSLGMVLAFLLTGEEPSLAGPRLAEDVEIPDELRQIVGKATRPNQETMSGSPGRTKTAGKLASELRAYIRPESGHSASGSRRRLAPPSSGRRIPTLLVGAAATVMALAAFFSVRSITSSEAENQERPKIEAAGLGFSLPQGWRSASVSAADRRLGMRTAAASASTLALVGPIRRSQIPGYSAAHDPVEVDLPAGRALRAGEDPDLKARMLFVFDTDGTYPTLLCRGIYGASATAVADDCESIARSLSVSPRPSAIGYPRPDGPTAGSSRARSLRDGEKAGDGEDQDGRQAPGNRGHGVIDDQDGHTRRRLSEGGRTETSKKGVRQCPVGMAEGGEGGAGAARLRRRGQDGQGGRGPDPPGAPRTRQAGLP